MGIIIVSLITSIAGAATYGPLGAFILEIFQQKLGIQVWASHKIWGTE